MAKCQNCIKFSRTCPGDNEVCEGYYPVKTNVTAEDIFNLKPEPTRMDFMEYADMDIEACQVLMDIYSLWTKGIVEVHDNVMRFTDKGIELSKEMVNE
jgi:predicted methyltransferase